MELKKWDYRERRDAYIKKRFFTEGINDKNLFKAVIMAGGPGSGKSYVTDLMFGSDSEIDPNFKPMEKGVLQSRGGKAVVHEAVSFLGLRIINSDDFFVHGLRKAGLPEIMDQKKEPELYKLQMAVRDLAKEFTKSKQGHLLNEMIPIAIDCTGKDAKDVKEKKEGLENIGYDVGLVFVDTTLEVALRNNAARKRKVDPELAEKMWHQVQGNKGEFKSMFGSYFFHIDNNEWKSPGSAEAKKFAADVIRIGEKFITEPLRNSRGQAVIKLLKGMGGKYYSDIEYAFTSV